MNGSTLARFALGVLIAAAVVPGAALADTPTLNPSGTLTFSWRGDPARGCQAVGVCDVSGSLDVVPQDQSGSFETPPSRNINIEDDGSVVRVTDPGSTPSQPHVCTQLMPVDMALNIVHPRHKRLQALVVPFSTPSSGDCAGPLAVELGAFTLPARRLPGPREAYDLSGTQRFGAGPYEVTLRSTVRARRPAGSANGGSSGSGSIGPIGPIGSGPKPKKELVEQVSVRYRISAASGQATTIFAGRPNPFCIPFDACGATGTITDSISGTSRTLEFDAQRTVRSRVSRRAALADFRAGRLPLLETGALFTDVQSAAVDWSAGSACTERVRQLNALGLHTSATHHTKVRFALGTDQTEDPFRNHCSGPDTADVLGSGDTLARTVLPVRDLGRRRLRIVMSGRGSFVAGSYAGSDRASATLSLRLVRVRAGTSLQQVFGHLP